MISEASRLAVVALTFLVVNGVAIEEAGGQAWEQGYGFHNLTGPSPPWLSTWTNSILFCTSIKDEYAADVREWLQYHKWLGVDHVHLVENNSETPIRDALDDFITSGFVTYETSTVRNGEMSARRGCDRQYRSTYNWIFYVDADELLHVRERGTTLKELLDEFKHHPGLAVQWIMFGNSNRMTRPPEGGMMRHYTLCSMGPSLPRIKTIVNSYYVEAINTPHNQVYRGGALAVNELHIPIPMHQAEDCGPSGTELCRLKMGGRNVMQAANRIALFHYVTKSEEDWQVKMDKRVSVTRAGGGHVKGWSYYLEQNEAQTTLPICTELSAIADICCRRVSETP